MMREGKGMGWVEDDGVIVGEALAWLRVT